MRSGMEGEEQEMTTTLAVIGAIGLGGLGFLAWTKYNRRGDPLLSPDRPIRQMEPHPKAEEIRTFYMGALANAGCTGFIPERLSGNFPDDIYRNYLTRLQSCNFTGPPLGPPGGPGGAPLYSNPTREDIDYNPWTGTYEEPWV